MPLTRMAALLVILTTSMVLSPHGARAANPASPVPSEASLVRADGTPFKIHFAGSTDAPTTILILHDWFGITDLTLEAVTRLAGAGARVAAVDLYDRQAASTHKDAWALMQGVDQGAAKEKIGIALDWLTQDSQSVSLFGMSMGADFAFKTALAENARDFDAMVIWYGGTAYDSDRLKTLNAPVLAIYGSKDGDAAEQAAAFSQAMDASGKHAEIYIYPGAAHAFAQPLFNEGKTYDPVAAEVAWKLTEDFLARQMK